MAAPALLLLPGQAIAGVGTTIVDRFWDSFVASMAGRLQGQVPTIVTLMQQAEQVFLGQTDDLTLSPVVQDAFRAMRVAGLLLLAFCTVISLAELAESGLTGSGGSMIGWFKRFFVAAFMTFGGLQVYGLWIRLFNALLVVFRSYLDHHWTQSGSPGVVYQQIMGLNQGTNNVLLLTTFAVITLVVLLILWFLVGGVRQAELILSIVIAPVVWPVYLIPSLDDIPKSALRGFVGLNAVLLFTVAMVRVAVRMAIEAGGVVNTWSLVPSIAMLMMTIFLPTIIKRIVGQGHTGVNAVVTAVQLAAGLRFLTMGAGGAVAAVSPPATGMVPQVPAASGASAVAPVPRTPGEAAPPVYAGVMPQQLGPGAAASAPMAVEPSAHPSELCFDVGESAPGSGRFDKFLAVNRYREGLRNAKRIPPQEQQPEGGP